MSKETPQDYLTSRLTSLGARIQDADKRLAKGEFRAKVEVAGELAILKQRQAEISEKLAKAQRGHDSPLEGLRAELDRDIEAITEGLERIFAGI
jgi:uncharacterized protein involved in exopolysaccharide biosynthesis